MLGGKAWGWRVGAGGGADGGLGGRLIFVV